MSITPTISLIDLSSQLPFNIDNAIKQELCFAETLVISCCHVEGSPEDVESELSWSCHESTISKESVKERTDKNEEDGEDQENNQEIDKEPIDLDLLEDDFHFFFFDDLQKRPPPLDKDASVLIIDKLPQINPRKRKGVCLCRSDDEFEPKCTCWTTVCTCGAITTRLCTCGAAKNICICHPDNNPSPVCTCDEGAVCMCHPDKMPRPICTCEEGEPCKCHPTEYPAPFCTCGGPKPCLCHPMKGHTACNCGKGVNCTCKKGAPEPLCICDKTEVCFCHSDHIMRRICTCGFPAACICDSEGDMKPICTCGQPDACACHSDLVLRPVCTCDNPDACICEYSEVGIKRVCTCGNPEMCLCNDDKVLDVCTCSNVPCLCHKGEIREECICDVSPPSPEERPKPVCTCKKGKPKKPKVKKEGFVTCHGTDPHHTFFDFAYGRSDKINKIVEKKSSKVHILGLHDAEKEACPIHEKPKYTIKKPRGFSYDCCSATGGLSISIETLGEDKDRFLVQVVSHFSKDGAKTGTKLVSIVDCNLHTLEENRTDVACAKLLVTFHSMRCKHPQAGFYWKNLKRSARYAEKLGLASPRRVPPAPRSSCNSRITKLDLTKERRNYMAICTTGYYNKVTQICGEKKTIKRMYHTFEDSHDFILEGSNLVLLRYIAVKRFKGEIKTKTVLMGGSVCSSTYICHGVSQGLVNGKPMFVAKVDRQILEECGLMHEAKTVMTLKGYNNSYISTINISGRIISHEWSDNNYFLHINPLLQVDPEKDDIEDTVPLRERWREDMQLLSNYLEFKSASKSEYERYASECEPLGGVVRDYLQALLLLRPADALHFTRHYFGSMLSAMDLPHDDFFDPCARHVRYYYFEE